MQIDPSKVQWDEPAAPAAAPASPPAIDVNAVKWDEPAAPKRSIAQDVGRQVGLTVRHAVNGVAAIPAMAADAVAGVANKGLDFAMGEGKGFRFPKQAQALDNLLTKTGLPQPENAVERVVGDATSAMAGAGGSLKAGQMLAASAASPVARGVGNVLASDPKLQLVSAATSAGASGGVREGGGGSGAQLAAGLVGAVAPSMATISSRRIPVEGGAQIRDAARRANEAGYVVPPADLSPGPLTETLSAISGKVKTAQQASAQNQTVSNRLARKALGIGDDVDLNIDTLEALRKKAAGAYAPVAGSGTVTPTKTYTDALDDAIKPFVSQSKSFPGMKVPEVVNDIAALRSPQFDAGDALNAIRTMREGADKAYRAGEAQSGKAYRQAAAALEDALETHLQGLGQPGADILKGFRDARQQIAKSYSVQNSLNPQTGAVNAVKLGADLAKGKPLSGELRTIAEAGQAFPRATQALKEAPKANSVLDWATAMGSTAASGNPLYMLSLGARPLARRAMLSDGVQRAALENAGTVAQAVPDAAGAIAMGQAQRTNDVKAPPETLYKNRIQAGYAARSSGGEVVPVEGGYVIRPK